MINLAAVQKLHVEVQVSERDIVVHMQDLIRKKHSLGKTYYINSNNWLCEESHDDRLPDDFLRRATDDDVKALALIKSLWDYV
jgi:hypothetical protein